VVDVVSQKDIPTGTAVGMQETYDEEMVRINVADRGLREVDQCE
jgi:hypothetical protein